MNRPESDLESWLLAELVRLGATVVPQFRVPGTEWRVDFYIASPVRAFVEIKGGVSLGRFFEERLHSVLENFRRQFADEIVPILVLLGKVADRSSVLKERFPSLFIVSSQSPLEDAVRQCAQQIWDHLIQLPYRFEGGVVAKRRPTESPPEREIVEQAVREIQEALSLESLAEKTALADAKEESDLVLAHALPHPSVRASLPDAPRDMFFDVSVSLQSVLKPEEFEVLKQELDAFSEEYRHEHYTACGLRLGRTLEHVVYALARAWGVSVNRTTLQVLSGLNNSFDQLSKTITDYATAEGEQKVTLKKTIQQQIENVTSKLVGLVFELDSDLHPKNTDVPVNVESILRDIRKQFRRHEKVRNAVNGIIDSEITRKILESRNAAAHASTNGARRELTRSDVDNSVELLRSALLLFTNVAFAVAEKAD